MFLQGWLGRSLSLTHRVDLKKTWKKFWTCFLVFKKEIKVFKIAKKEFCFVFALANRCFTKILKYDFRIYCGKLDDNNY